MIEVGLDVGCLDAPTSSVLFVVKAETWIVIIGYFGSYVTTNGVGCSELVSAMKVLRVFDTG